MNGSTDANAIQQARMQVYGRQYTNSHRRQSKIRKLYELQKSTTLIFIIIMMALLKKLFKNNGKATKIINKHV